jgi:Peptidase M15
MDVRLVIGGLVTSRVFALATAAALVVAAPVRATTAQAVDQAVPQGTIRDSATNKAVADSAGGDVWAARKADDPIFGRSGKLRARLLGGSGKGLLAFPFLSNLLKGKLGQPGIHRVDTARGGQPLTFISLLPFSAKKGGSIGAYRMGFWPAERGRLHAAAYRNPDGFIEVTAENQDTPVSEHFRLRDFLTKDQFTIWPKYLVLREELIDKLELVIAELQREGIPVRRMTVMSGFRTPQYNQRGVGRGGRAQDSRHQYGDAADVFVDNDGDGWMDDLNRDGRVDHRDAQLILAATERVERRHPDLAGGVGVYRATRAHGPFAHVDVRGRRARWGSL